MDDKSVIDILERVRQLCSLVEQFITHRENGPVTEWDLLTWSTHLKGDVEHILHTKLRLDRLKE